MLAILPQIKQLGVKTIAIVGNMKSHLATGCDVALPIGADEEAGPFKFAGSSSALNSMALCDALIMAVAAHQGFSEQDYLNFHPGGAVGKKLKKNTSNKKREFLICKFTESFNKFSIKT